MYIILYYIISYYIREPNVLTMLKGGKLDLVVNVPDSMDSQGPLRLIIIIIIISSSSSSIVLIISSSSSITITCIISSSSLTRNV